MLIVPQKKALLLRSRAPDRLLTVLPTARLIRHRGYPLVAIPHRMDEVKVLRNLGIQAPPPILFHYDWPRNRHAIPQPFAAQREAAAFLSLHNRAFNLSDLGTGKTLATLWAYDYLRSIGQVRKALVITPLSTLERVWGDEVFSHFPHLTATVVHGSQSRRTISMEEEADLYLINHHGVKVRGMVEAINRRTDIDLVIIDEISQAARNAGTGIYKALKQIVKNRRVWGLTGTPTPNAPTDAWAQCALLVPERVPPYFRRFRDQVMRQAGPFRWVSREDATELVYQAMQPAVRFTRDECVDLPPCLFEPRFVELTPIQSKAYREMMNRLHTEVDGAGLLAVNEAVKAQKLIQIACGVAYGQDGQEVLTDATPRMRCVAELCEQASTKVIVFAPFVSVLAPLAEHLRRTGFSVEIIHGGVGKDERSRIFHDFQRGRDPRVLVAQPAAMSHGLTLTAASTIVWYAPTTSADVFTQANGRITRPSQKHSQLVVMIEGTDLERRYYKRLQHKEKLQGALLDLVKNDRAPSRPLAGTCENC